MLKFAVVLTTDPKILCLQTLLKKLIISSTLDVNCLVTHNEIDDISDF